MRTHRGRWKAGAPFRHPRESRVFARLRQSPRPPRLHRTVVFAMGPAARRQRRIVALPRRHKPRHKQQRRKHKQQHGGARTPQPLRRAARRPTHTRHHQIASLRACGAGSTAQIPQRTVSAPLACILESGSLTTISFGWKGLVPNPRAKPGRRYAPGPALHFHSRTACTFAQRCALVPAVTPGWKWPEARASAAIDPARSGASTLSAQPRSDG